MAHPFVEYKLEHKLTWHQIAALCGVSRQMIFNYIAGTSSPSPLRVVAIEDATGIKLEARAIGHRGPDKNERKPYAKRRHDSNTERPR